jgi:hypothetical protein
MQTQEQRFFVGRVIALLSLGLALTLTGWAQVQTGRIVGTVNDAQKATMPGATVVVTDVATNQSITVRTHDNGDFVATPLNPASTGWRSPAPASSGR